MDWNSLLVVADYFGLEEMGQEVRQRRDQEKEKDRQERRQAAERHTEMMQVLIQIREEVGQLSQALLRRYGGQPRPGGPHPPVFPDPDFPYPPGPEFM